MKKTLSIILAILIVVTMIPMSVLPASAAENLDYNIKLEVVDWAVYETSGELIGEFNAVEHGDAFYDVSLTQADDGTFTCSYQIALERNGGNTAWGESSISFKIDSCEDEFLQEFEKSFYSNYNIYYTLKVTRSAGDSHTFKDATCVAPKTCAICGVTEGDIDATAHSWANLDGICANGCGLECTHENLTGSVCEICGEHICSYNNGFCTECDAYQPATLVTNENYESFYLKADYVGYYAISNAGQLFWYANYINTVDRTANAVITEDIDLENRPWTPIGSTGENSNNFRGIFDGQNYIIRGLYVEGDRAGLGFFGEVRTGTVKNFTIYGEVVVNTEVDYVGGVIGSICGVNGENDLERNGAIIQNIKSFVNLTVKAHGVGKIGGFVGYANHQSLIEKCSWYGTFDAGEYRVDNGAGGFIGRIQENSSEVTIRNCAAYGTIKTNYAGDYNDTATIYMGGFLSFSNTSAKTTLENCLFAGRFKRGENLTDEAFLGAFGTLRSVNAIKNCYYLGDDGLEAVHSDSPLKPGSDNVEITKATGEELKKGTVAKKLGEYWEQGVHYPTLKDHGSHWGSETYSYTDNGDGTHDMVCTGCGYVEVYNEAHSGGTATCTEQAKCERCGASYGELDPDNHASENYTYTDNGDGTHSAVYPCCGVAVAEVPHTLDITTGKCSACGADMTAIATVTDGTNTYYAADADTLNKAVTAILENGSRTFTVELPADTEAEMITAIRRVICDTEGVADGSINLTLKGVTSIPGTTNWDGVAFGPGDIYDEAGEIVDQELVTQLASVNLPDATEIGAQAFYFCENLVTVSAPKAQTIGAQAFGYTALTSVEFPELTTIPTDMFSGTWTLSSAKFPKVTTIEQNGLLVGAKFEPENNPTPFPLELTAEGDITFNGSNHFNIASQNYSGKVDLVLNIDKKDQVTFNDDGTATWQVRDDLSYTFKSITFTCTDGTTNHSYTYTDNGDGTHDATCSACGAVVDNEVHTIENHVCIGCGAKEIVVSFNAGDYEWKTGDQINFVREVEGIGIDDCVFTATVAEDGTVTWTTDKPFCWYGEGEQKLFAAPNNGWSVDYFVIPEDQSTSAKLDEADLVNGMWVGTPTTDTVTFNMTHRMAKVTVNYEFAEGVTADISELKVYSIAQICLFSLDDWSIKLTSAGQLDVWVTPYLDGNQFTAFIIPETYATGEDFIKITLSDGTVYEVKMNKAVTFEEGAEYTYKVVITADGAYLTCADECSFEYTDNGDGLTHSKVCTECGYVAASEAHSGGTATCTEQAECQRCGASYGEVDADGHDWSNLDGVCANGCGTECPHDSYTDGVCDKCGYECPHEWGEGVLTRPTFETDGYYTYTCTLCGHSYTEPTKKADTTALNDVSMKVMEYIGNDTLTQEAANEIHNSYLDILKNNGNIFDEFGFVRGDLVEEDQPAINAITEELQKIIADADEKIASGEYVKAEYTEIDEAIDDIEEKLASENVTDEGKAELEEIKKQLEEMKADENTSAADVAELEKALEDYEEELDKGIEDGTLVEVDGDAIADDVNKKWAEKLEAEGLLDEYEDFINNQKATDEAMATVDEINDFANSLEGTVAENAENIAKLNEMLDSLLESWENCLRGTHNFKDYEITSPAKCEVNAKETSTCWFCGETDEREVEGTALEHSFTKYEETEAPKCGVAGKEIASCDHGCGATDEKEIEALEHADKDGDLKCDHGCGYEFEQPVDPEQPDTPDEPEDPSENCDHLCHKSGFLGFIWKIVQFFSKLFKINPVCECGAAHY